MQLRLKELCLRLDEETATATRSSQTIPHGSASGPEIHETPGTEVRQKYPSLAEIVREETDGGRRIVQFYLGVAEGTLDGFRDHHRAAAARRLDKIAPGLVREYLQKYHSAQVRKSMRGSLFPRGRISPMQPKQTQHTESAPRGPNRFQRRLAQLVRDETGDGRTIFDLLNGVMHGTLTGFKPHHRLESAKELASYLTAVVGTKMEPHTPTPREPVPEQSGIPAPRREPIPGRCDRTMLQPKTRRPFFIPWCAGRNRYGWFPRNRSPPRTRYGG